MASEPHISVDFNKLIENHLARESTPKTLGRYYPSEIGSCMRKTWFSYISPKPTQMDLIKVFEVGNILHHFIAQVMSSEKNPHIQLVSSELPFKIQIRDFIVSGRIDDLLLVKESNKTFLIEVKSTASLDYTTEPSFQHVMQLQLYMHALKYVDGFVLYIEKNTVKCRAFEVKYDERVAAEALNRFSKLHDHLISKEMPVPEARLKSEMSWMCRKCDWREECWAKTPDADLQSLRPKLNGF
jgi:CRISPR/Cas system-associated exonuclease Cas4 (RecB family)